MFDKYEILVQIYVLLIVLGNLELFYVVQRFNFLYFLKYTLYNNSILSNNKFIFTS